MKLTDAQYAMLVRAKERTLNDGSGSGVFPNDGIEERVLDNLASKGLVTLPTVFIGNIGAKITPTGRAALERREG